MDRKKPKKPKLGNSLAEAHPAVAEEWHPHKNGTMSPRDVTRSSGLKVWWRCSLGHEWLTRVANRTQGKGCPVCQRNPKLGNSLAEAHPDVADQWHPHKNGDLSPHDVSRGSVYRAWWVCPDGHEWEATVNNRTNGSGCPDCRCLDCPRKPKPGDSLAEVHPNVADQWHPHKNGDLSPHDVSRGSVYRAWWVCPDGHEWEATVSDRTKGSGCPVCSGHQVLPGFNSLADLEPAIAAHWHPHKNGTMSPRDVTRSSGLKVWWKCSLGHEWPATVYNRSKGNGCPDCPRKPKPGNSLAEVHPDVAEQWHPHKNGSSTPRDVTRSSGLKVWWKCSLGHEWEAIVNSRTSGHGCPRCVDWGTSEPERLLRKWFVNSPFVTVHPDEHVRVETPDGNWLVDIVGRLADVCHTVHPGVAIEYDGKYWHEQADAVERDLRKTQDLLEAGYVVVRVREHDLPHLDLRHPNLLQVTYGDPLNTNWETFELVKMLDSFFRFHWSLAARIV